MLKRRESLGLNRNQLARLINISQHSLSDWETGKVEPRYSSTNILTEWLKRTDFYGPDKDFARSALSERVAVQRRELGLSQKQLAQFLGVRGRTLNKWESGTAFPGKNPLKRLMQILSDDSFERVAEHAKFVELGQDIKKGRKRLGLTQAALAARLGVAIKTVVTWELGGKPSAAKLENVSSWLAEEISASVATNPERHRIGKDIRRRRLALGISLNEVGRQLSVDPTTVRDWEAGRFTPRRENAIRIAEWLAKPAPRSSQAAIEDVVRRMKERRRSLGWTQDRLTRHLGVGRNRVCEWEKGRGRPGPESLEKIEKWMSGQE